MLTAKLIVRLFHSAAKIQRKRMILTVTAIAWGTIAIILLLSFGEGLKRSMDQGRRGLGDSLVILWMGETEKAYAGLPAGRPIRLVPDDVSSSSRVFRRSHRRRARCTTGTCSWSMAGRRSTSAL
jgi:hypothetical protein